MLLRMNAIAELMHKYWKPEKQARKRHPERWSKQLRDWEHIQAVYLNPEKEAA
ncbi:hypothetical protein OP457_001514 [Escherichia coli]|nr:hypothetical protein [Escherichia coli]EFA4208499.1 hypothetical protein [Escherichia coli O83:H31]EEZ6650625.1 hypothetical protein [Escherichia coli]EEZ6879736.1 hypothetical protein [Escherichia coli]EEZ9081966.1 hypothetical protein [Escherichia coli]EEZ9107563.1 hypothetical protein [Escherichia coli]